MDSGATTCRGFALGTPGRMRFKPVATSLMDAKERCFSASLTQGVRVQVPTSRSKRTMRPPSLGDIAWGLKRGLIFAGLVFAVAIIQVGLHWGEASREPGGVARGLGVIGLTYAAAGAAGGLLLGTLRGLTKTLPGATALGILVAMPAGISVEVASAGLHPWGRVQYLTLAFFSLMLGGGSGAIFWHIFRSGPSRDSS